MEVIDAIKTRRSVRKYKPTPVKDEDLKSILESARWAPSWRNTQCWRFVVVRDASLRAKLAETLHPENRAIPAFESAPVVVVACAELGKSGYYKGELATDKGDWYMFDVALAAQNMVLTAHALGLGVVHVGLFDARKAAQVLGVSEGSVVVVMILLGHPDEVPATPSRKELSEIVFWERYGPGGGY